MPPIRKHGGHCAKVNYDLGCVYRPDLLGGAVANVLNAGGLDDWGEGGEFHNCFIKITRIDGLASEAPGQGECAASTRRAPGAARVGILQVVGSPGRVTASMRLRVTIAQMPIAGPSARAVKAHPHPAQRSSVGTSRMVAKVRRNPRQV